MDLVKKVIELFGKGNIPEDNSIIYNREGPNMRYNITGNSDLHPRNWKSNYNVTVIPRD